MRNFYMIFFTALICSAMWYGGNIAMVASWFIFTCGLSGILVGVYYDKNGKTSLDIRDRLLSRNAFVYLLTELVSYYAVYRLVDLGYFITAFVYVLGSSTEMYSYINLRRKK